MPVSPKKPCRRSGCPALVDSGYCDDHRQDNRQQDKYRGSAQSRGYDNDWQRVRLQALKRDMYLCLDCLDEGRATVAKDVDHITPISIDGSKRLDLDNLRSLCRPHHRQKTEQDKKRYRTG